MKLEPSFTHEDLPSTQCNKDLSSIKRSGSPGGCECHFCNSSLSHMQRSAMLSSSSAGVLPPLTQPQLSLYPHIHGTAVGVNDIVASSPSAPLEGFGQVPQLASNAKPHIFSNPYLGSDLLTEQLIREWDSTYGDTLSLPSSTSIISDVSSYSSSVLANGIENLSITSRPSYTGHLVDHTLPFIPDAMSLASASTSIVSCVGTSNQISLQLSSSLTNDSLPTYSKSCYHKPLSSTMTMTPLSSSSTQSLQKPLKPGLNLHLHSGESVITHTKSYQAPGNEFHAKDQPYLQPSRSGENSTSRGGTPSESETSGHDEWSSGDDSVSSNDSSGNHCNCCYCHMMPSESSGGRQNFSDRRERLLKILSHKKKANNSPSSSSNTSTLNNACRASTTKLSGTTGDTPSAGQQTLDEILNFIEGHHCSKASNAKKAAKKAKQKEKKVAELQNKKPPGREETTKRCHPPEEEDYFDEDEDTHSEPQDEDYEDEEEEEDGPLAELRRRAPDVTITVVKPGQRQAMQSPRTPQMSITRDSSNQQPNSSNHPLSAKSLSNTNISGKESWPRSNSRTMLPSGNISSMSNGFQGPLGRTLSEGATKFPSSTPPSGLSNLLKDMGSSGKDNVQDADGKSSQMVTIRRVMDPGSAEPTVTITLKGEEADKDKVLYKLVNGQGATGGSKEQVKKKVKQIQPVYDIPPGTSPEEAKRLRKQQKKDRQRLRKEQEKEEEERLEQMQHLQLKKQQEFLQQQEKQIKQQQAALQRQQEELLKKKQQNSQNNQSKKKGKKGKKNNETQKIHAKIHPKMDDDVARNFNLPPGVSISKVAGQPGMVTISNTISNNCSRPFLPNGNLYRNNIISDFGRSGGPSAGFPITNGSIKYPEIHDGCSSNLPWNPSINPCTGSPEESVIVVDTNARNNFSTIKRKTKSVSSVSISGKDKATNKSVTKMISKKLYEKLSSEDKIEATVRGEADASWLNQTQKKKYKKRLKSIKEEKELAIAKQKEEDALMDQMYLIARGSSINHKKSHGNASKSQQPKNNNVSQNKKQSSSTSLSMKNNPKDVPAQKGNNAKDKRNMTILKNKSSHQQASDSVKQKNSLKQTQLKPNFQAHISGQLKGTNQSKSQTTHVKVSNNQVQQKLQSGTKKHTTDQNKQNNAHKNSQKQVFSPSIVQSSNTGKLQTKSQQSIQPKIHAKHQLTNSMGQKHSEFRNADLKRSTYPDKKVSGNFTKTLGYSNDIGHEARYAQYLAANASTLAAVESSYKSNYPKNDGDRNDGSCNKKAKKKGKKGVLEDLTTIDSVFTPKDVAGGELDETEREVEAFKRFCLYNVPRNTGEKPKVNFNVKDILFKNRHGGI